MIEVVEIKRERQDIWYGVLDNTTMMIMGSLYASKTECEKKAKALDRWF